MKERPPQKIPEKLEIGIGEKLETLLPKAMRLIYQSREDDPLGHLSASQLKMMRVLDERARTTSEIGFELGLSLSAVMQTLEKLLDLELVEKTNSCDDRRIKHLQLSAKGHSFMEKRKSIRATNAELILSDLSAKDRARVIECLDMLISVATAYHDEHAQQDSEYLKLDSIFNS